MISFWVFSETTPSSATTAVSSQPVSNAASYLIPGVCGPLDDALGLTIVAELQGGQGGTCDVYFQTSPDDGANWFDAIHFPQLAAGAAAIVYKASLNFLSQPASAATTQVGKNLVPALAANTTVQGPWGPKGRLVFVTGAGTTGGSPARVTVCAQRPRLGLL